MNGTVQLSQVTQKSAHALPSGALKVANILYIDLRGFTCAESLCVMVSVEHSGKSDNSLRGRFTNTQSLREAEGRRRPNDFSD